MDHDHVADYFGGDHAMAELFLNIINSDVSSGTALGVGFLACAAYMCTRIYVPVHHRHPQLYAMCLLFAHIPDRIFSSSRQLPKSTSRATLKQPGASAHSVRNACADTPFCCRFLVLSCLCAALRVSDESVEYSTLFPACSDAFHRVGLREARGLIKQSVSHSVPGAARI